MLVAHQPGDKIMALLFAGGHGKLIVRNDGTHKSGKGNFLVRSRIYFNQNAIATSLFDAPSDRRKGEGLSFEYRMSDEHGGDIRKAVQKLHKTYGLAVWLVGTSRGSTSAANGALSVKPGEIAGLVLTSSAGVATKHGGNVLNFYLDRIKVPTLVVHHRDDGCGVTPFRGAVDIQKAMTGSARTGLMDFDGGQSGANPCKGKSHHGFLGIEKEVIDAISIWMKR